MNSIFKELKFTTETCEDFKNWRLPTLDMEIWVENRKLMYNFWEKPMVRNQTIHKESALPENSKIASLTQEVIRRMRNTSELVGNNERIKHLNNFTQKLRNSGYSMEQAERIIWAGVRGYQSALERAAKRGRSIHTSAQEGAERRNQKKLLSKTQWFKDGEKTNTEEYRPNKGAAPPPAPPPGPVSWRMPRKQSSWKKVTKGMKPWTDQGAEHEERGPQLTTVLFVECTHGGEYAARLRGAETGLSQLTNYKVKSQNLHMREQHSI